MKAPKQPTEDQAEIVRRAGLDPATVTVTDDKPGLPLEITYHGDGGPLRYWVFCNERGAYQLSHEKPIFTEPKPAGGHGGTPDDEANAPEEPLKTEKGRGKWRATGKRALSDRDGQLTFDPVKLEADLRQRGFTPAEARAMVGQVCDGDTIREAARKAGLSHGAVGKARVQRVVKELRSGKGSPAGTGNATPPTRRNTKSAAMLLHVWTRWTRGWIADYERGRESEHFAAKTARGIEAKPSPYPNDAKAVVNLIRYCPGVLLTEPGRPILAALVDLLEAANWGVSKRRVPSVTAEGKRKRVARAARNILAGLMDHGAGDSLAYPPGILAQIVAEARVRVEELRKRWRTTKGESRLRTFKRAHPEELAGYTDRELLYILGNAVIPSKVAVRLAERATGISAETFERAYRSVAARPPHP